MEVCKGPLRRRPAAGGIAHATQRMLKLSDGTGVRSGTKECWLELGKRQVLTDSWRERRQGESGQKSEWILLGLYSIQRAWHIKPFVDDDDFGRVRKVAEK